MPQNDLKGKVAIVTGRDARYRARNHGTLASMRACMLPSAEHCRNWLTTLSLSYPREGVFFGMVTDVSKFEDVRRFIAGAHAEFGALHILVNNAGAGAFAHVARLSPEAWDKMIARNLSGVHYCCHEIMPIFKHAGGGDIVNIGSLAGVNAFAGGAGYNASKFGLVGYSEAMMLDHRYDGVRVSLICRAVWLQTLEVHALPANPRGRLVNRSAIGRIAPGDIADIVVNVLKMPGRTTVSRVDVRPSRPPRKS